MHIVLFAVHVKVFQSFGDGVFMVYNIDPVIDDIARMSHPLTTHHKLVFYTPAEAITHTPMPTSNTHTAFHCFKQAFLLLTGDLSLSPDRNYQVKLHEFLSIDERIKGI